MKTLLTVLLVFIVGEVFSQVNVSVQTNQILTTEKTFLLKLSDSKVSISNLTLDDNYYVTNGYLLQSDIDLLTSSIVSNGKKLNDSIQPTKQDYDSCGACKATYAQKLNELKSIITAIRLNRNKFIMSYDAFVKNAVAGAISLSRVPSEGPHCSFAFYVCLGVGATSTTILTAGVAAAASVYLCACGFCQLKPPGC